MSAFDPGARSCRAFRSLGIPPQDNLTRYTMPVEIRLSLFRRFSHRLEAADADDLVGLVVGHFPPLGQLVQFIGTQYAHGVENLRLIVRRRDRKSTRLNSSHLGISY